MTEHVENRGSGLRTAAERVYAALTGLSLLGSLAAMLAWSHNWVTPMWLTLLRCAVVLMGLMLWDRRDMGFRILAAYLALVFLRLLVPSSRLFDEEASQTLFNGAWSFIGCFSLGHILGKRRTETFLKIFLSGWVFCMACYCGTAVYAVWTDQKIWNIGGGGFWGLTVVAGKSDSRLNMLFDANTSGVMCGTAVMAAFLCAAGYRNKWMKGIHIFLLLPVWTALSLTDSRTAQIGAAAGVGAAAGILVLKRLLTKKPDRNRRSAWLIAAVGAMAVAAVCVLLMPGTTRVFNVAKSMRGGLVTGAAAEERQLQAVVTPKEVTAGFGEKMLLKAATVNAEGEVSYQWQYSSDGEN